MTDQITFTPPALAKYWRCHPDRVHALIRSGKLRAFTLRDNPIRPRYRISLEAVKEFETTAAVQPPPKRRRTKAKRRKNYFADKAKAS